MSYQTVPLPPPATYDPDPIGAAIATISAIREDLLPADREQSNCTTIL